MISELRASGIWAKVNKLAVLESCPVPNCIGNKERMLSMAAVTPNLKDGKIIFNEHFAVIYLQRK